MQVFVCTSSGEEKDLTDFTTLERHCEHGNKTQIVCSTYRLPKASHHAHELRQTWSTPNQIQGICKHYLPEKKIFRWISVVNSNWLISGANTLQNKRLNLARHKNFPIVFNRVKWTSTSKDSATLQVDKENTQVHGKILLVFQAISPMNWGEMSQLKQILEGKILFYLAPRISFFSCTLRLWSRIGECKN